MRTDQPMQDQPQAQDQLKRGLPTTQGIPRRGIPTQAQPSQGLPTQGLPRRGVPRQAPSSQGLPTREPSQVQSLPLIQEQPAQRVPAQVSPSQVPPILATPQIQALPPLEDLDEIESLPEIVELPQLEEPLTSEHSASDEPASDALVESQKVDEDKEGPESKEDENEDDDEKEEEPQSLVVPPKLKQKEPEKKKKFLNKSQMFAIFWLVVFIVYIPIPISPDPLPDPLPEFLGSEIDITPKSLNFDNMQLDDPRTTALTVRNVSEHNVSISPLMTFDSNSSPYLTSKLEDCSSGGCVPVTYATKIAIPKGGQHKLTLTVTMTKNIGSTPIAGEIKVTGEVIR